MPKKKTDAPPKSVRKKIERDALKKRAPKDRETR